ncbi:MAG: CoA transferase [Pseudaminobacter sp.]
MSPNPYALAGLRVIELTVRLGGACFLGRLLAELGAEVVLVEPTRGHPLRSVGGGLDDFAPGDTFETVMRGKRSLAVDLESAAGRAAFLGLLSDADVLLTDWETHHIVERLGLLDGMGNEPSLIRCCVSAYGLTGPYADIVGSEITVQGLAGVLSTNGEEDDGPLAAGVPIATYSGAFYGLIGVLAAIYYRMRTGRGQLIDQSEFDAVIALQGTLIPGYLLSGKEYERVGNGHTLTAPWNVYRTRDGWVVISTVGEEQWQRLARVANCPQLVDDPRFLTTPDRVNNSEALDAAIEEWSRAVDTVDVIAKLEAVGVPVGPVMSLEQAVNEPHAQHRIVERREGTAAARTPFRLSHSPTWRWGQVPELDQESEAAHWTGKRFPFAGGNPDNPTVGPLHGIEVVDIGILTAGPMTGRILGMLGAHVLKIEPPLGERTRRMGQQIAGTSYLYYLNNTDKDGLTLDLSLGEQRDRFRNLLLEADVVVTNVGETPFAGIGTSAELIEANHGLIYCSISGYGGTGPKAGHKSFDSVIQAVTGIMSLTGAAHKNPTKVALSIVDLLSALSGTAGVLTALIARERSGKGQAVDASLFDVGLWMTQLQWPPLFRRGHVPSRQGNRHVHHAPHNCFKARDGYIAVAVENDAQWTSLAKAIGNESLATDTQFAAAADRLGHVDAVEAIVSEWVSARTRGEAVTSLQAAGVPAAAVSKLSEAVEHPLTSARGMLVEQTSPQTGKIRVIGSAIKMSHSTVAVRRMAPSLGAASRPATTKITLD